MSGVLGQMIHDDVRRTMDPITTKAVIDERWVRDEQDPVMSAHQLRISGADIPANLRGQIFLGAGADLMLIQPRDGHPDEKVGPLEGNSSGSAGTQYYAECVQEHLQRTAVVVGERVLAQHGNDSLVVVMASGTAEKPTRWSHEKFLVTTSGVTLPWRTKLGSPNVDSVAYVPGTFEKNLDAEGSRWTNNPVPTVVGMPMEDMLKARGWEARNPNNKGEYELFLHGRKVNSVVGDGGLSQLQTELTSRTNSSVRIDPARCLNVNPTVELGNDKFKWLCLWNDFMKQHGHLYPIATQRVEAHLATNDAEIRTHMNTLYDMGKTPILKAHNARWGIGNKKGSGRENIDSDIQKLRTNLERINVEGKQIAGQTVCVTECFIPRGVQFEEGDKRKACQDFGVELRVYTLGDHAPKYAYKQGQGKLRSVVAEAKLGDPVSETANQSDSKSKVDATLLTLPMNESGLRASNLTKEDAELIAKMQTHMWQFGIANADFYQLHDMRTSALDEPAQKLVNVRGPW